MFTRKWLLTTFLVLAAGGVMLRLGVWQLDRLAARRLFNQAALEQRSAPELDLNANSLEIDLEGMAYRAVRASGTFVFEEEIALRNQVFEGRPAYRLITPLRLAGAENVVLVDRGYVPAELYTAGEWEPYASPEGEVVVTGLIRLSQTEPDFGSRSDPVPAPGEALLVWNLVHVERIASQVDGPVLPVYIQQGPDPGASEAAGGYPVPVTFMPELTEGPHMGYAIQWFAFAAILWVGYPFYLIRESRDRGEDL